MLTFTVSPQEFSIIMRGIGALPLADAMQTFVSLSQQAERQRLEAQKSETAAQPLTG